MSYYKKFSQNSIDGVYIILVTSDGRFMIAEVNPAMETSLGMSKEELENAYIDEIEDTETRITLLKKYQACIDAGKTIIYESEFDLPSGYKYFSTVLSPIKDKFGKISKIFAIARDLTEEKKAQNDLHTQLLQRQQEYKSLADNIPIITVRYDINGCYLYINNKHKEKVLNKDIDFLIGKTIHEVFPDGRYKILEEAVQRVAKSGKKEQFKKASLPSLDEKQEIHDITIFPEYDHDGNIISVLVIGQDMTEVYHTQDELIKKEQELRALAETIPGMLISYHVKADGTSCIPYASASIKDVFGLTADEVKDDTDLFVKIIHPDDLQKIEEGFKASAKDMSVWHHQHRIIHPIKGERWIAVSSKPIPHPDGGVIWHGYVYDITEQKKSEKELLLTNSAMNTISEAIELIDPMDGSLYYVNDAACKMLGYTKEEFFAMTTHDFVAEEITKEFIENITQEIDKNGFIRFESSHRSKNGTVIPVEVTAFWLDEQEKRFTLTVVQDISERKVYEKQIIQERDQYQSIFENSLNGIVVLNNDFKILNINNAALAIFGYKNIQMIPDNLLHLCKFENVDKLKEIVDNTIQYKINQHITQKCININKQTVFLNINTIVQNKDSILLFVQDITYNVLFEEQSLLANKGMMLDTIAHQWRQPLAEINSILFKVNHILKKLQDGSEMQEDLRKIEKITGHLSKTLDDFKGVLVQNEKKLSINLKELMNDVIGLLNYSSKNIGVAITNNISDLIVIDVVEGLLKQVLFSILQNSFEAFKNSLEFNKYIVIDAFLIEDELIIAIIDNAGGVQEIDHTKIFDKDYSTKKGGSGIGLYISNLIVSKIFEGKILVQNTTNGLATKIYIKV